MAELDRLARALAAPARVRILEELLKSGPLSADGIAQRLNGTPVTIHHHLRVLREVSAVEEAPSERSGKSGRPATLFRISARASSLQFPPRHYEILSEVVLGVLASLKGPRELRRIAEKTGRQLGKQLGAALLARSGLARWTLADFRKWFVDVHAAEIGAAPEVIESGTNVLRYRLHNCIVLESALKYPGFVCTMDAQMMGSAMRATMGCGTSKKLLCLGDGDPYCEYLASR
jgi:predicted ArsR family transcriptional regulator